jgi:hypothetical protein
LEFAALEIPAVPQPQITETSTTEPTAKPTTEPTSDSTPETFPAVPVAIASAASIAVVSVALLVYFKKRKK